MLFIMGLFIPELKEFPEMMYQYETDYIFDSSKFENKFNISHSAQRRCENHDGLFKDIKHKPLTTSCSKHKTDLKC